MSPLLFLGIVLVAIFVIAPILKEVAVFGWSLYQKRKPAPEPEKPGYVTLYDGPENGKVHPIESDDRPHFFIAPYLPVDENGQPSPDNIIGQQNGVTQFKPSLAYYQQITEGDYFYVRDITFDEFNKIQATGNIPTFDTPPTQE